MKEKDEDKFEARKIEIFEELEDLETKIKWAIGDQDRDRQEDLEQEKQDLFEKLKKEDKEAKILSKVYTGILKKVNRDIR